ncbi:hypothetical protein BH20VER3_BH20VER3_21620 [soil metagenome]
MDAEALRTVSGVVQQPEERYHRPAMTRPRLSPLLWGAALLLFASCTELPNDVGVRQHRSTAQRTRLASRHPVFSSWYDDPAAKGESRILINLTRQQAFFFRGDTLIGRTNISSGRREFETPPGKYRVIQKDEHHVSSEYGQYIARSGAVLQPDVDRARDPKPEGARFVGAPMPYFLRFRDGYGMHAGFVPRFRASHGCVRMPTKMAKHFFEAAEVGMDVEVIEPPIMVQR